MPGANERVVKRMTAGTRGSFKNEDTWTASVLDVLAAREEQGYATLGPAVQVYVVPSKSGKVPFHLVVAFEAEGAIVKVCDPACDSFRYRNTCRHVTEQTP